MSGRAPPPRRLLKAALIALAAVLVVVVGAAAIFVLTFDANRWKPRIAAAVEQATGRQIALNGPIGLKLSLRPTIEASDVALLNPPGFSRPQMAKIGALDLRLDLLALLRGRYEIERLAILGPDILFERSAAGATNWAAAGPGGTSIAMRNFTVRDARLGFRDDRTGRTITAAIADLSIDAAGAESPMRLSASGEIGKTAVTLSAETGSLERLLAGGTGSPWPAKAELAAAGAKFSIDGTIADPLAGTGYRMAITGSIPDLAALSDLATETLPALKQIAFSARAASAQPNGLAFEDLKLTSAQGDLAGGLTVRLGERPGVVADLKSTRLDADALFPGPPPAAPARRAGGLFPDTPLPVSFAQALDADVRFQFADLILDGQHWRAAAGRLVVNGGQLQLDPFSVTTPGGKLTATVTVDATKPAPPVALTLHAPAYSLASLLAAAGNPVKASGQVAINADLRGAGTSPHAIAGNLDGTLLATMGGGRIDSSALGGGLGQIFAAGNLQGILGSAGNPGDIRCMTLRLVARNGVATLAPFVLVTAVASVEGSGSLALGPETMNLMLRPHGSIGGKSLTAAVAVRGSFMNPQVTPEAAGTVAGIGGLVEQFAGKKIPIPGLGQTTAPSCTGGGATATTPAAPTRTSPQLPNPTNLLKNLFR